MSTDERIESYLVAATAGLRTDRELELEAQTKLRSQIEAQLAETTKTAAGDEAAAADPVAHVLAGLAPAATVAAELAATNGTRIKRRARLRRLERWLLIPAFITATLYALDLTPLFTWNAINLWIHEKPVVHSCQLAARWLPANWFGNQPRFTPDQTLILDGDLRRSTPSEQQRAIWEAHPQNKVYLHHYLNQFPVHAKANDELDAAIAAGQQLDSANARFDYLLAYRLLEHAITVEYKPTSRLKLFPTGKKPPRSDPLELTWTIKDRAKLDQAMALLRTGMAKPEYRRYVREMLKERLSLLGEPQTMPEKVDQLSLLLSTLPPHDYSLKTLADTAIWYAGLLIREGHPLNEAEPYLHAWRVLTQQLIMDSVSLVDIVKIDGLLCTGQTDAPEMWRKISRPKEAEVAQREAERLSQPVAAWRQVRKKFNNSTIQKSGSLLAYLLLAGLGVQVTAEELAPIRQLEYLQVERLMLAWAILCLFFCMAGCGLVYGRWRLTATDETLIPLRLMLGWRDIAYVMGYGTLLPVLGYYLYTRWLPWNSHNYSLGWSLFFSGTPVLLTELTLLSLLLAALPLRLAAQVVRRRCRELGMPVPQSRRNWWGAACLMTILLAMSLSWQLTSLHDSTPQNGWLAFTSWALLVFTWSGLGLFAFDALRSFKSRREFGFYHGSLARTLVPLLSLSVIVLSLLSRPYLEQREKELMRRDTLLQVDAETCAASTKEARLVRQLTAELRQAAATLPPAPRLEGPPK
ncbi:MAG: hypothetical protein WC708_04495 [Lentisphaeria bacterium]